LWVAARLLEFFRAAVALGSTLVTDNCEAASAGPPPARRESPLMRLIFVRIPFAICGMLVLAAVAINVANVIGRYVFDAPVSWAEEVMSYGIIWGVFIATAAITYQGNHLRMDLLVLNVRGVFARVLGAITVMLIVACSLFVMVQSFTIVRLYATTWETSMGARIPLVYAHSALLVGFVLMALAAIVRARNHLTGRFD
jgi:TRAP-type C4-dicarboxylate transport system permease small subunit